LLSIVTTIYGPGTSISDEGEIVALIRKRKFPLIGDGAGVWSSIHIADAARATYLALAHANPGIYNIVDDDPPEVSVWLPELAQAVGARPPLRVPAWVGRFAGGRCWSLNDDRNSRFVQCESATRVGLDPMVAKLACRVPPGSLEGSIGGNSLKAV
jgi:nucleoside-diphosphate-sugar epimerase